MVEVELNGIVTDDGVSLDWGSLKFTLILS